MRPEVLVTYDGPHFGYESEDRLNNWLNLLGFDLYNKTLKRFLKASFLQASSVGLITSCGGFAHTTSTDHLAEMNDLFVSGQHSCPSPLTGTLKGLEELRVIEADVLRTRGNEEFFRLNLTQKIMYITLVKYCSYYEIEYLQGLNEVLAPLLSLSQVSLDHMIELDEKFTSMLTSGASIVTIDNFLNEVLDENFNISLILFEKFIDILIPTLFHDRNGVQTLRTMLASLHTLVYYYDSELSKYLLKHSMTTDIYAQSWLITLFSRKLPMELTLYLWDVLLQINCPCFIIFVALSFLIYFRNMLLYDVTPDDLPQVITNLIFTTKQDIDNVIFNAILFYFSTPDSCIEDMTKNCFDHSVMELEKASGFYDLMYRPCVQSEARDLLLYMNTITDEVIEDKLCVFEQLLDIKTTVTPNIVRRCVLLLDCRDSSEQKLCTIENSIVLNFQLVNEIFELVQSSSSLTAEALQALSMPTKNFINFLLYLKKIIPRFDIVCYGNSNLLESQSHVTSPNGEGNNSSNNNTTPAAIKILKQKKMKQMLNLIEYKLATSLMLLHFDHVSVLKGFTSEEYQHHQNSIKRNGLISTLAYQYDGFASLIFHLAIEKKLVVTDRIISFPNDDRIVNALKLFNYLKSSEFRNSENINVNIDNIDASLKLFSTDNGQLLLQDIKKLRQEFTCIGDDVSRTKTRLRSWKNTLEQIELNTVKTLNMCRRFTTSFRIKTPDQGEA